jgi:hypothetical protein
MQLLKVWTGPTQVETTANRLEAAGMRVDVRGTENVHVVAENVERVLAVLPTWKHRDVQVLREVL